MTIRNTKFKKTSLVLVALLILSGFLAGFKMAQNMAIEKADIKAAQKILDLNFDDNEIAQMLPNINRNLRGVKELHEYPIDNSTPPALWFKPQKGNRAIAEKQEQILWGLPKDVKLPEDRNELAFYTVAQLSVLIQERKITSVELTQFFIERLKKHNG